MFSWAFRQRAVSKDFSPLKDKQGFNRREFSSLFALLAGSISCLAALLRPLPDSVPFVRFMANISDEVH